MTNTVTERQLHVIAIGRNDWILAGFDERVLLRLRLKILHAGDCMGGSGDT
jgi:hypothetical protein